MSSSERINEGDKKKVGGGSVRPRDREITDIPAALILTYLNSDNHQTSLQITESAASGSYGAGFQSSCSPRQH